MSLIILSFLTYIEETIELFIYVDLAFKQIPQQQADRLLSLPIEEAKLSFNELKSAGSTNALFSLVSKQYNNAIFEFPHLLIEDAKTLILYAESKSQELTVELKPIEIELLKIDTSLQWIAEYKANGYQFFYDIFENSPLPWRAMCLVTVLGIVQMTAGFILMATTIGLATNIGLGLMAEGISDILRVATAGYTRRLNMGSYISQKAISITISLLTAGFAAYRASLTTSDEFMVNMADDTYNAFIAIRATSHSFAEAGKHTAIQIGENITAEGVRVACSSLAQKAASSTQSEVITRSREAVLQEFSSPHWQKIMNKIFAMDCFLYDGTKHYELQLMHNLRVAVAGSSCDINKFFTFLRHEMQEMENVIKRMPFHEVMYRRLHEMANVSLREDDKSRVNQLCEKLKKKGILLNNTIVSITALEKEMKMDQVDSLYVKILSESLNYYQITTDEEYSLQRRQLLSEAAIIMASINQGSVSATLNVVGAVAAAGINFGLSKVSRKIEKGMMKGGSHKRRSLEKSAAKSVDKTNIESSAAQSATTDIDDILPSNVDQRSTVGVAADVDIDADNTKAPNPDLLPEANSRRHTNTHSHRRRLHESTANSIKKQTDHVHRHSKYHHHSGGKNSHDILVHPSKKGSHHISKNIKKLFGSHHRKAPGKSMFLSRHSPGPNSGTQITVQAVRTSCIEFYKESLRKIVEKQRITMEKMILDISDKNWFKFIDFLVEQRKIIKLLISILLSEKISSDLELSAMTSDFTEQLKKEKEVERIDFKSEEIVELIMKAPLHVVVIILRHTGVDLDKEDRYEVKSAFQEYIETKKLRRNSMMLGKTFARKVGEIDMSDALGKFTEYVDDGNYSECGKLLKHGKLGTSGYIAGTVFEGFFKAQQMNAMSSMKVKSMMMAIAQQVLKNESEFMDMIGGSIERREKLIQYITDSRERISMKHSELVAQLNTTLSNFLTQSFAGTMPEYMYLGGKGLIERQQATLDNLIATDRESAKELIAITGETGVTKELVEQCHAHSRQIIETVMQTVKEVAGKDESSLRMFFQESAALFRGASTADAKASSDDAKSEGKVSELGFLGERAVRPAVEGANSAVAGAKEDSIASATV